MGYYIEQIKGVGLPSLDKADFLLENGTTLVGNPLQFQPNLVCVVENGFFDAAAFCFSEKEMLDFNYPDGRRKTWLIVPDADVLSGYKK